jgi:hypothetical protein
MIQINDLLPTINTLAKPIICADDTSFVISTKKLDYYFRRISKIVLCRMSKWFAANRLARILDKTIIITFIVYNSPQHALNVGYKGKCVEESVNTKFVGLQTDNQLNRTNDIEKLIPKLSAACYAVISAWHINSDTPKSIYFAYFDSTIKHGIIFGDNSSNGKKIFTLQKNIFRLLAGVKPRISCESLFKRLEIVTLACDYVFLLLLFVVNNQEYF